MTTHTFTLTGSETVQAFITLENGGYVMPGMQSAGAYGIAFITHEDDTVETVADTSEHRYVDYCPAEIAGLELQRLITDRWGIDSDVIDAAVSEQLECTCEPEDDDE